MRSLRILTLALAALLLCACTTNPYLKGFTGQASAPLSEEARVIVVGADREDPLQMKGFEQALAEARSRSPLLGTSTIVSATSLRDAEAADAGRALGATRVLYSFAYLNSTVERESHSFRRYSGSNNEYDNDRRTFSTTRHWYEYRAYFFGVGDRDGVTPE